MADIAALGNALEYPGLILLWAVVVLRSPSAVRAPQQRGIWIAVATGALAMTLNVPDVTRLAVDTTGLLHTVALAKNLAGVVSAGAVLYFVMASTSQRRLKAVLIGTSSVIATLLVTDAVAGQHREHSISPDGQSAPSTAYWLVLIGSHLVANAACVQVCWRYSRKAACSSLKASLVLFGVGTALAGVFWAGQLLRLTFGTSWVSSYLTLLMSLHAVFRAGALLIPMLESARIHAADAGTTWRLWPLWRDLVEVAPYVALATPRTSRTVDVLWPQGPRALSLFRKVVEMRDALLHLAQYSSPTTPVLARGFLEGNGVKGAELEVSVLACVVDQARRTKLAGHPSAPPDPGWFDQDNGGFEGEKSFMLAMAQAYQSTPVCDFAKSHTDTAVHH
ncbi:MAB_1171c family putative transporter [Streptomyces kronopolitis]